MVHTVDRVWSVCMKTAYDQRDVALDRDTSRRQVTQGFGALVLGALGALLLRQPAALLWIAPSQVAIRMHGGHNKSAVHGTFSPCFIQSMPDTFALPAKLPAKLIFPPSLPA